MEREQSVIIIRLEGGLGNQLFQLAYAFAIQSAKGGRIIADTRLIDSDPVLKKALNQVADLPTAGTLDKLVVLVLRLWAGAGIRFARRLWGPTLQASRRLAKLGIHHHFETTFQNLGSSDLPFTYIQGNFMSEKYFANARADVRARIDASRPLQDKSRKLAEKIKLSQSVALHIRRGDYLSDRWREKLHVCNREYYLNSISIILEKVDNPLFFIFTTNCEDAKWVRENYTFIPEGSFFVPHEFSDFEHFSLMAACRHFIISNSTFSWWASYLSDNKAKIIVAPEPWNRNAWDMRDIYMPEWTLVNLDIDDRDDC